MKVCFALDYFLFKLWLGRVQWKCIGIRILQNCLAQAMQGKEFMKELMKESIRVGWTYGSCANIKYFHINCMSSYSLNYHQLWQSIPDRPSCPDWQLFSMYIPVALLFLLTFKKNNSTTNVVNDLFTLKEICYTEQITMH